MMAFNPFKVIWVVILIAIMMLGSGLVTIGMYNLIVGIVGIVEWLA